jgi:hypothetical protein
MKPPDHGPSVANHKLPFALGDAVQTMPVASGIHQPDRQEVSADDVRQYAPLARCGAPEDLGTHRC